MSSANTQITVEGHEFEIVTEQAGGVWRAEVLNSAKSAFAFDPTYDSEEAAIAHASDALLSSDISEFLG